MNPCKQSEQSALSSFLDKMLNDASRVEIQIDNARSRRRARSCSPNDGLDNSNRSTNTHKDRASFRWEQLASKDRNDVMVTAPLRRHVYCEPEKLNAYTPSTNTPTASISLRTLTSSFPQERKKDVTTASPSGSSASSTSDLLEEALDLLASASNLNMD